MPRLGNQARKVVSMICDSPERGFLSRAHTPRGGILDAMGKARAWVFKPSRTCIWPSSSCSLTSLIYPGSACRWPGSLADRQGPCLTFRSSLEEQPVQEPGTTQHPSKLFVSSCCSDRVNQFLSCLLPMEQQFPGNTRRYQFQPAVPPQPLNLAASLTAWSPKAP